MSLWSEFKQFAIKGNAFDLAVGVVIGAAFGKIVNSMVADLIMPPIGMLLGGVDFTNLFVVLGRGEYPSLAAAEAAGAATINYGRFLQTSLDFAIVAFGVFVLVKLVHVHRRKAETPPPAAPSEEVLLLRDIRDALQRS